MNLEARIKKKKKKHLTRLLRCAEQAAAAAERDRGAADPLSGPRLEVQEEDVKAFSATSKINTNCRKANGEAPQSNLFFFFFFLVEVQFGSRCSSCPHAAPCG